MDVLRRRCSRARIVGQRTPPAHDRSGRIRDVSGPHEQVGSKRGSAGRIPAGRPNQPTFAHTELSMTADTRDFPGHPTRGGLVRAAVADYADRDAGVFSFRRYDAEAAQFMPIRRLACRDRTARMARRIRHGRRATRAVLPAAEPRRPQHAAIVRPTIRFHDRHLLIFNAEARVAMMTHVDRRGVPRRRQCRRACRRSESRQAIVGRRAPLAYAPTDVCPL